MQMKLSAIPTPYSFARIDADSCTFLCYAVKYLTSLAITWADHLIPGLIFLWVNE